jgi:hypothetical protein
MILTDKALRNSHATASAQWPVPVDAAFLIATSFSWWCSSENKVFLSRLKPGFSIFHRFAAPRPAKAG